MNKNNSKRNGNSKRNYKNNRSNPKDAYKFKNSRMDSEHEADSVGASSRHNDVSWYITSPQQLIDSASYPFAVRAGNVLNFNPLEGIMSTVDNPNPSFLYGGVAAIKYLPTVGMATDDSYSALNLAMRSVYSFVRHANSGSKNYDAPDLMFYLLTMDSIYTYWSWMIRLYGVLRLYSYSNSFYPQTILKAMGVDDPQSLMDNMAQFRAYINNFAMRANSYAVPTVFPLYTRHMWLTQNIFHDRPGEKAQAYVFTPSHVYEYKEGGIGSLEGLYISSYVNDIFDSPLDGIKALGDKLLNAVVQSEDIGIMSGDILKAYGSAGLFKLALIEENFSISPIYNESVLTQIHNLTIVDVGGSPTIKQNTSTGNIYQDISANMQPTGAFKRRTKTLLNLPWDSPKPEDVMVATRLTAVADLTGRLACGSEVVTEITIYTNLNETDYTPVAMGISYLDMLYSESQVSNEELVAIVKSLALASNFNYFPQFYLSDWEDGADQHGYPRTYGFMDINNITVLDFEELNNLHINALGGEFGVPYILNK